MSKHDPAPSLALITTSVILSRVTDSVQIYLCRHGLAGFCPICTTTAEASA